MSSYSSLLVRIICLETMLYAHHLCNLNLYYLDEKQNVFILLVRKTEERESPDLKRRKVVKTAISSSTLATVSKSFLRSFLCTSIFVR